MTDSAMTTENGISRRKVAGAALWSVPVLSMAGAAPAFAASPVDLEGCFTMTWTSGADPTHNSTYTTASYSTVGTVSDENVPVRVSSTMNGGSAAASEFGTAFRSGKGGSNRNFETYDAGQQTAVGFNADANQRNGTFVVQGGTTQSVLVLNQGSTTTKASQTLTFTFGEQIPESITMNIYDITEVSGSVTTGAARYTDQVVISGGTVSTGTQGGSPSVRVDGSTLTGTGQSSPSGNYIPVTVTDLDSNSISLEYRNGASNFLSSGANGSIVNNAQYIAIGDVRVCY